MPDSNNLTPEQMQFMVCPNCKMLMKYLKKTQNIGEQDNNLQFFYKCEYCNFDIRIIWNGNK